MSQDQSNIRIKGNQTPNLSPDNISQFLETQRIQAQNEAHQLKLQEKEIEFSAKSAEKAMDHQAEFMKKQPSEQRKTMITVGAIMLIITLCVCSFFIILLFYGYKDFAVMVGKGLGYLSTTLIGYFFGKYKNQIPTVKPSQPGMQDAEVMN